MKTLIINGSPRRNGDTASLLSLFKETLKGEVIEVFAFHNNIKPCNDCRACWKTEGCIISDDMHLICNDSYDNIIIASPVYDHNLPSPMIAIQNRLNYLFCNKHFLKLPQKRKPKTGAIILLGGGGSDPVFDMALRTSKFILRELGADHKDESTIVYMETNKKPATADSSTTQAIKKLASKLNC